MSAPKKTIVYVDGFNLYYRALKDTPHKWLNIKALADAVLDPQKNVVIGVKYFTARVSGRAGSSSPARQQAYLNALATVPEVKVFFGHFLAHTVRMRLANPPPNGPKTVEVVKTEEKGSDVNLASHLVHDGWKGEYEAAAVVSNDTDLCEPIRLVVKDLGRPVGIICPEPTGSSTKLQRVASFVKNIRNSHLSSAQFAQELPGGVKRPQTW